MHIRLSRIGCRASVTGIVISVLAPVLCRATQPVSLAELMSGGGVIRGSNELVSIVCNVAQYTNLVAPVLVTATGTNLPYDLFWGVDDPPISTVAEALLDLDPSDGVLNPLLTTGHAPAFGAGGLDVFFPARVTNHADRLEVFLFNPDAGSVETWKLTAITNGTAGSAVTGGAAVTFNSNAMGPTGLLGTHDRQSSGGASFTQVTRGIGLDLDADFGVESLVGVRLETSSGDPSVVCVANNTNTMSVMDLVTALHTQVVNRSGVRYLELDELELCRDGVLMTYPRTQLANVEVMRYRGGSTTVLAVPDGAPAPAGVLVGSAGIGRAGLSEDWAVNTGAINPGAGNGLAAPPTDSTPGLEVRFVDEHGYPVSVVNRPGIDVVLVELDDNSMDSWVVSPLDAGAPGRKSAVLAEQHVRELFGAHSFDAYLFATPPTTLAALETEAISSSRTSFPSFFYAATALDLSDLGYAHDEAAGGLFIQSGDSSNTVDPVLIVGLPPWKGPKGGTLLLVR